MFSSVFLLSLLIFLVGEVGGVRGGMEEDRDGGKEVREELIRRETGSGLRSPRIVGLVGLEQATMGLFPIVTGENNGLKRDGVVPLSAPKILS